MPEGGATGRGLPARTESWVFVLLVPALCALGLAALVPVPSTWGWDESMHAELPAARMLLWLGEGEPLQSLRVLLDCEQYPFAWPVALAVVQGVAGLGEAAARAAGWLAWAGMLGAVFALARRLERAAGAPRAFGARHLALLLALASPLALAFAPTLFLEVPSALATALALLAWLAAWEGEERGGARGRMALAGLAASLAFFTKFNYGSLLGAALALDLVQRLALAPRGARARRLGLATWLAAPPLLLGLWWFVLPLPDGPWRATSHRAAFAQWMTGNLEMASAPWTTRALDLVAFLCGSPLAFLLVALGLAASARRLGLPAVRTLWLALAALELPALLHPFHLDRFLVPGGPCLWALAALGWSDVLALPRARAARVAARWALVGLLALAFATAPRQNLWLADRLGLAPADPRMRAFAVEVLEGWTSPDLSKRRVPTAGLARAEAARILDALAEHVGPDERVGWLGISSELSPAALHLGLLARGGSRRRFLEQAHRPIFFVMGGADPGWAPGRVETWAADFDVVVTTLPPNLKGRASRAFVERYQRELLDDPPWESERVLELEIARPPQEPQRVVLLVCRRR